MLPDHLSIPLDRRWESIAPLVTRISWMATVGSTMDVVLAEAQQGGAAGLLVVADEQTAGRGRRGHEWASPPGAGLYFSLLIRPPLHPLHDDGPSPQGLITLAAGVAVGEGIAAATGLSVALKWPNDVFVGRRKMAGILAEGVALGTPAQAIVLGIGINVEESAFPPSIADRATSIATELGRSVDRGEVLACVLASLAARYRTLVAGGYEEVLSAWRANAPWSTNTEVEWDAPQGVRRGVTAGIDRAGALLIRTPQGMERVIAGELRWGPLERR